MYNISNNNMYIDGRHGKYDNKVTNPSVKYGRNAVDNFYSYFEKPLMNDIKQLSEKHNFSNLEEKANNILNKNNGYLKSLPTFEFEYRYMPTKSIDKLAVLGAAYEELQTKEISIEELNKKFAPSKEFTSEGLDLNNDGKVDIAEYGTSILAADMLSKSNIPEMKNIDGTINTKGLNNVLAYAHYSNKEAAKNLYTSIYNQANLGSSLNEFSPD